MYLKRLTLTYQLTKQIEMSILSLRKEVQRMETEHRKARGIPSLADEAYRRAMMALLEEKPLETITVSSIIARAGYSRAGFYQYYDSKYDLMQRLLEDEADRYTEILCGCVPAGTSMPISEDFSYRITRDTFRNVFGKKALYRFIINSEQEAYGREAFCRLVTERFLDKAEIRRDDSRVDPELENIFYYCQTRLYLSYIAYWSQHGFAPSPEEMARQVTCVIRCGMEKAVLHRHRKR